MSLPSPMQPGQSESSCQRFIVAMSKKHIPGYKRWWRFAGDMNGLVVSPGDTPEIQKAKLTLAAALGLNPGETDLRYYFLRRHMLWIELKTDDGELSPDQIEFHAFLRKCGWTVEVVYCKSPWDGWVQVKKLVEDHIRLPWWHGLW